MTTIRIRLLALALVMVTLVAGCSRSEEKRYQAKADKEKTSSNAMAPGTVLLKGAGSTFLGAVVQEVVRSIQEIPSRRCCQIRGGRQRRRYRTIHRKRCRE